MTLQETSPSQRFHTSPQSTPNVSFQPNSLQLSSFLLTSHIGVGETDGVRVESEDEASAGCGAHPHAALRSPKSVGSSRSVDLLSNVSLPSARRSGVAAAGRTPKVANPFVAPTTSPNQHKMRSVGNHNGGGGGELPPVVRLAPSPSMEGCVTDSHGSPILRKKLSRCSDTASSNPNLTFTFDTVSSLVFDENSTGEFHGPPPPPQSEEEPTPTSSCPFDGVPLSSSASDTIATATVAAAAVGRKSTATVASLLTEGGAPSPPTTTVQSRPNHLSWQPEPDYYYDQHYYH